MDTVMCVTARQTWSATPRVSQYCVSEMHSSEEGGKAWAEERDRLKQLLDDRRNTLIAECEKLGVPLNPTMDGFFAWLESDNPSEMLTNVQRMEYSSCPLPVESELACVHYPWMKFQKWQKH